MRIIYIISLTFLSIALKGQQISKLDMKDIYVSFDKTTHIIFPTNIKYFSAINELVLLKKPVSNIISVKAFVPNFGETNMTVVTADGSVYAYNLLYKGNNNKTSYFVANDSIGKEINCEINMSNQLHISFPAAIKYIDYGANWIEANPLDNIQNIIKVEAFEADKQPTNVSIVDSNNRFYTFCVQYNERAKDFNLFIDEPKQMAILAKEDLTDNSKDIILDKLKMRGRDIYNLGIRKNSTVFSINNIFVRDNKLIFRFNLKNNSNIKYDIDYMKFYIIDKKQTKESALQEVEYKPLFLDNFKQTIQGKKENTYSVCFEKFTIPDKKYFVIEINERTGGRHVYFKIDNSIIENAQNL